MVSVCLSAQVVVYAPMLEVCRTDDELASVLAHETAHVLSRHAVRLDGDTSTLAMCCLHAVQ